MFGLEGALYKFWGGDPIGTGGDWGWRFMEADIGGTWPGGGGLIVGGNMGCPTLEVGGMEAVEGNCGVGKRGVGPVVGGPYEGVGLPGCMGLKPGVTGPTVGPGEENGVVDNDAGTGVGLKAGGSDPTMGGLLRGAAKGVGVGPGYVFTRLGFSVPIACIFWLHYITLLLGFHK